LAATIVTILSFLTLPSSKVTTIALLPLAHTDEDVIMLTVLPTNASPCATSHVSSTSPDLPESTHHGGAPCMSWHSLATM
jgi:hypothetical protein